jgi:hypothetical protein
VWVEFILDDDNETYQLIDSSALHSCVR